MTDDELKALWKEQAEIENKILFLNKRSAKIQEILNKEFDSLDSLNQERLQTEFERLYPEA